MAYFLIYKMIRKILFCKFLSELTQEWWFPCACQSFWIPNINGSTTLEPWLASNTHQVHFIIILKRESWERSKQLVLGSYKTPCSWTAETKHLLGVATYIQQEIRPVTGMSLSIIGQHQCCRNIHIFIFTGNLCGCSKRALCVWLSTSISKWKYSKSVFTSWGRNRSIISRSQTTFYLPVVCTVVMHSICQSHLAVK